jgi:photosystem II stability/assembly factor-like uncharacterized protein
MSEAYTTKDLFLWIQFGGANQPILPLGCHDLDDIEESKGGVEYSRRLLANGSGWEPISTKKTPPDPITTRIGTLFKSQRDLIERIDGTFTLYVLAKCGGRSEIFSNYDRGLILPNFTLTSTSYGAPVKREEDADIEVGANIVSADPIGHVEPLEVTRLTTASTQDITDAFFNRDKRPVSSCGTKREQGQYGTFATESAVGPATADILFTSDSGVTIAAGATDPFAAGLHAASIVQFAIGADVYRTLVSKQNLAASQGQVAYSDNNGTTWTTVSVGGAAAGHGCTGAKGIFALDMRHIWLASAHGYIYRSSDGGQSWTAQESGVIHTGSYNAISFQNERYGIAVGAAGIVAKTTNGGANWTACSAITATPALTSCQIIDSKRFWVGTATGKLFYTEDAGVTWTERSGWQGSGTGSVKAVQFFNEYFGFIAHQDGAVGTVLYTFTGGMYWLPISLGTNAGINTITVAGPALAYVCTDVVGGTGGIFKIAAQGLVD